MGGNNRKKENLEQRLILEIVRAEVDSAFITSMKKVREKLMVDIALKTFKECSKTAV
ncbi:MAG: hypothetical protein ACYCX4_07315 [Bacillota bacterium]